MPRTMEFAYIVLVKTWKLNELELEILPRVSEFSKKIKNGIFEHGQIKTIF